MQIFYSSVLNVKVRHCHFLKQWQNSCAIVSTDVGIANEVLPEKQRQYIVSRDAEAFYDSLRNLLDDQRGLKELQKNELFSISSAICR